MSEVVLKGWRFLLFMRRKGEGGICVLLVPREVTFKKLMYSERWSLITIIRQIRQINQRWIVKSYIALNCRKMAIRWIGICDIQTLLVCRLRHWGKIFMHCHFMARDCKIQTEPSVTYGWNPHLWLESSFNLSHCIISWSKWCIDLIN